MPIEGDSSEMPPVQAESGSGPAAAGTSAADAEARLLDDLARAMDGARHERERMCRILQRMQARLQRARSALAQALRMADLDELTGLPNRRALSDLGRDGVRSGAAGGDLTAVLFVDLDGFKPVNDRNGHATGDSVLRIVADRLRHAVRRADRVFRVGGDEFVCVLQGLPDAQQALAVAHKVLRAIALPCEVDGHRLLLSASLGLAIRPRGDIDLAGLAHLADRAMYKAKSDGGGIVMLDGSAGDLPAVM